MATDTEQPDATAFFYELDRSLEDIDAFFKKRAAEIRRRLHLLEARYHIGPVSDLVPLELPSDEWEELVSAMLDLRASLQKLLVSDRFSRKPLAQGLTMSSGLQMSTSRALSKF